MGFLDRVFGRAARTDAAAEDLPADQEWSVEDRALVEQAITALERLGFEQLSEIDMGRLGGDRQYLRARPVRTVLDAWDEEYRPVFARVFPFDAEMVVDDTSYPALARALARATGSLGRLGTVSSSLDELAGTGRLLYELDGRTVAVDFDIDGDWADSDVVEALIWEFAPQGCTTLLDADEQGGRYFWVQPEHEDEFRAIVPGAERY